TAAAGQTRPYCASSASRTSSFSRFWRYVPMPKSCSLRASMPIRMSPPGMVSGALQPQVRVQERGPARMVLGVEGPMAVAVSPIRRRRGGLTRAPAQMGDRDVGREQDASSPRPQRGAEVDVLEIHEIALVEQADRLRVGA